MKILVYIVVHTEVYLQIWRQKIYLVCLFREKEKFANARTKLNGQRNILSQNQMEILMYFTVFRAGKVFHVLTKVYLI